MAALGSARCDMDLRRRTEQPVAGIGNCGTIDSQLAVLCAPALLAGKLSRFLANNRH